MDINLTTLEKAKIRENKLKQIKKYKLNLYGLNKTDKETEILMKASEELAMNGRTDILCPRCGNELILLQTGGSYELKCKNRKLCIKIISRGI